MTEKELLLRLSLEFLDTLFYKIDEIEDDTLKEEVKLIKDIIFGWIEDIKEEDEELYNWLKQRYEF